MIKKDTICHDVVKMCPPNYTNGTPPNKIIKKNQPMHIHIYNSLVSIYFFDSYKNSLSSHHHHLNNPFQYTTTWLPNDNLIHIYHPFPYYLQNERFYRNLLWNLHAHTFPLLTLTKLYMKYSHNTLHSTNCSTIQS